MRQPAAASQLLSSKCSHKRISRLPSHPPRPDSPSLSQSTACSCRPSSLSSHSCMTRRSSFSYHHVPEEDVSHNSSVRSNNSSSVLDMSFKRLTILAALLPLGGFLFCVLWSLVVQFNKTTATHCNVDNLLPSLSAATGSFMPQKAVWKVSISLHTVPRIVVFIAYFGKHKSELLLLLNVIEVGSLLGLALFGSNENYSIHSKCFGTFLISSLTYMFLVSYTDFYSWCRRTLRAKTTIAWLNLFMMISATYFFFRHNSHCEPYVYTLFALSEYIIVLSNIYFHSLAYYDLGHLRFTVFPDDRKESQMTLDVA